MDKPGTTIRKFTGTAELKETEGVRGDPFSIHSENCHCAPAGGGGRCWEGCQAGTLCTGNQAAFSVASSMGTNGRAM